MAAEVGAVATGAQRPAYSLLVQVRRLHTHVHGCADQRFCNAFVPFAEAKVCQLYDSGLLAACQQHIVQLYIPVGDPHAMAVVQCKEKLLEHFPCLLFLQYAA